MTPVYRYADRSSGEVRAPLSVGETFESDNWLHNNGEPWVLMPAGARVPVADCMPVVRFET